MTGRKIIAAAVLSASLAACGVHTAPVHAHRCPRPALLADGQYSSYRTQGTMPSGQTVRLSDGDLWSCRNGTPIVHGSAS